MKRVLVLYYSQSGQLRGIVNSLVEPLRKRDDIEIFLEELQPIVPYPFPWPVLRFLDLFPECVCMEPPLMKPLSLGSSGKFDLIILAYQPWYFSPSLPVTGFVKSRDAEIMRDVPVMTVIGCKDTWLMAQEKMKKCLQQTGARLIDNVVFRDKNPRLLSLISTSRWLWTGKKTRFFGVFPSAGVSREDISSAKRFGIAIAQALHTGEIGQGNSILRGLGAVKVVAADIQLERILHEYFFRWGRIAVQIGEQGDLKRLLFIGLFAFGLLCLIPALLSAVGFFYLFLFPVRIKNIARDIENFERPSGSSTVRLRS